MVPQEVKNLIVIDPKTRDLTEDAVEYIASICEQKRDLDIAEKQVKKLLFEAMDQNGITRIESDRLLATVVAPSCKPHPVTDWDKLREDFPEIVAAYTKTVSDDTKAPYLKITVRRA